MSFSDIYNSNSNFFLLHLKKLQPLRRHFPIRMPFRGIFDLRTDQLRSSFFLGRARIFCRHPSFCSRRTKLRLRLGQFFILPRSLTKSPDSATFLTLHETLRRHCYIRRKVCLTVQARIELFQ